MSAVTRLVKYKEYAKNWIPGSKRDTPNAPNHFMPPQRKEAWAAFWAAVDRRNRLFGVGKGAI